MLVQMDAREIFSAVFRQIWKFLAVFVPVVLAALIYVFSVTPQYASDAKLLVRFGQDARPDMAISQNGGGLSAEDKRGLVQSNLNILSSRDLVEKLLKDITVKRAYPDIAENVKDEARQITAAADRLIGKDLLTRSESSAGIIETTLLNENPETAKLMLDELLALFIEKQSEIYGNPQAEAVREQADAAYAKLEEANQELFAYKTKVGVASIDEEITLLLKKRSDISEYLSRNEEIGIVNTLPPSNDIPVTDADDIDPFMEEPPLGPDSETVLQQNRVGILPAKMGEGGSDIPFPALDEIQKRIDELRAKEVVLRQTYKPGSDVIRNLQRSIEAESAVLKTSIIALQDKLQELDARIAQMSEYKAVYDTLARKVQFSEETYKTAKGRLQAAEVNSDLNQRKITQISVLEQPAAPERPAKPKKFMVLLLSMIIGGAFAAGICLISELIDQRLFSPSQVSACLPQPLLSSFSLKVLSTQGILVTPTYWEQSCKRIFSRLSQSKATSLPASEAPSKILSIRSMSTLYQSVASKLQGQAETKSFLIASAYKDEGACTIAWELSRYVAEILGKKVLFINYGAVTEVGRPTLLEVALEQGPEDRAVKDVEGTDGFMKTAYLANPDQVNHVLANIQGLSRLISSFKNQYDMIILPAPNILDEPSHMGLVRLVDTTLFVIEADRTRVPVALKALELLKNAGAQVTGIILNKRIYYIPKWLYRHL